MPDQTRHVRRDDDPCTSVRLPFEQGSVRRARTMLADDLQGRGLAAPLVDDARLVVSELVSNSIAHGRPNHEGLVDVAWCVDDRTVRISVHDGGPPVELRPRVPAIDSTGGRGLVIVDHLCDAWDVEHDDGLRVTARLGSDSLDAVLAGARG